MLSSIVLYVPSERPTRNITKGCITRVTDEDDKITSTRHVRDVSVGADRSFSASSADVEIFKLIVVKGKNIPFKITVCEVILCVVLTVVKNNGCQKVCWQGTFQSCTRNWVPGQLGSCKSKKTPICSFPTQIIYNSI